MKANIKHVYRHVKFLTTVHPARNYSNRASLEKIVLYIVKEFRKAGTTPELQTWEAQGGEYKNVIASYNPKKNAYHRCTL